MKAKLQTVIRRKGKQDAGAAGSPSDTAQGFPEGQVLSEQQSLNRVGCSLYV